MTPNHQISVAMAPLLFGPSLSPLRMTIEATSIDVARRRNARICLPPNDPLHPAWSQDSDVDMDENTRSRAREDSTLATGRSHPSEKYTGRGAQSSSRTWLKLLEYRLQLESYCYFWILHGIFSPYVTAIMAERMRTSFMAALCSLALRCRWFRLCAGSCGTRKQRGPPICRPLIPNWSNGHFQLVIF